MYGNDTQFLLIALIDLIKHLKQSIVSSVFPRVPETLGYLGSNSAIQVPKSKK